MYALSVGTEAGPCVSGLPGFGPPFLLVYLPEGGCSTEGMCPVQG